MLLHWPFKIRRSIPALLSRARLCTDSNSIRMARSSESIATASHPLVVSRAPNREYYSNVFATLTSAASFAGGHLAVDKTNPTVVHASWTSTIRDLKRMTKRKALSSGVGLRFLENHKNSKFLQALLPVDISDTIAWKNSPSGIRRVVLRQAQKDGNVLRYVEIWEHNRLVLNVDTTKAHGEFYSDPYLSGLSWSSQEDMVCYIAELPKPEGFEENLDGEKFLFRPDFGEALTRKSRPCIVVFDLKTKKTSILDKIPYACGQCAFTAADKIVFAGFDISAPRRLGIHYCFNRKSGVYRTDLNGNLEHLSAPVDSARLPRLNKSGTALVYFSNSLGGPHSAGTRLFKYDFSENRNTLLVDFVRNPDLLEFPGLYVEDLPQECWHADDMHILISSIWRSQKVILSINSSTGEVTNLTPGMVDLLQGSWSLLGVYNDLVLVANSSPTVPEVLYVGSFEPGKTIEWIKVSDSQNVDCSRRTSSLSWALERFENDVEAIIIRPNDDVDLPFKPAGSKPPLLVVPHGGPHTTFVSNFTPTWAAYASLGFVVALVNYRGSLGFGQDQVEYILGKIGTSDCEDVHMVATSLRSAGSVEPNKIALLGGSHGGFITSFLIGKHPGFYQAAVVRNPVTNLLEMLVSDIPDWVYTETGYAFQEGPLSTEFISSLQRASPISLVDKIKTPALFTIGENDKRVPPLQGLNFFYALKQNAVDSELFMYPDGHALDSLETEHDCFVNICRFLEKHLPRGSDS